MAFLGKGKWGGYCVVGVLVFKWVLVFPPVLVFKWVLIFPPVLAGMGIKAAEALIWVVSLSFVKGNLIRRAGIERQALLPSTGIQVPMGYP